MTVALTGATGFVGKAVLAEAARQGADVRALTRRDSAAQPGVTWVAGDLADRNALGRLVKGSEAVLHIAGVVSAPDAAGFQAGNVTGTLNLIEAARGAGVGRFVFVSSLSAREPQLSAYGASKRKAERLVMASGLDWTIVRPPAIYGPHDAEMFELFRSAAKWGVVPLPPAGRLSLIHVADLARLLLALVPGGEGVTGAVFEPDDGHPGGWTHREMGRAIGWAVGRRPWTPHFSPGILANAARIDGIVRRGRAKLTADRVGYMCHPDWVASPARAVPAELWRPQIGLRDGLRETAAWYREAGWL